MPDVSTVHFDVALTNLSIAYRNNSLVGSLISPEVTVRKQGDRYFVYDPDRETLRSTFDGRAPGTEASEVNFALSSDSYFCEDHALESAVPDEERDNADAPLQPEIDRVEFLSDKLLLNQEIAIAGRLLDLDVIPGIDATTESEEWSDDEIDPVAAIETARTAILAATHRVPNTLVLSHSVYTRARHHPLMVERIKYSGHGLLGAAALAELFDVERVLVARAVYNAAPRGQAPSMLPVWGDSAVLMHVPPRAALKSVAPLLTFNWSRAGGGMRGHSVQRWREERRKATMIRVQKYYDVKVVAPGAAYAFTRLLGAG